MKKFISVIVGSMLIMTSFVGCGDDTDTNTEVTTEATTEEATTEEATEADNSDNENSGVDAEEATAFLNLAQDYALYLQGFVSYACDLTADAEGKTLKADYADSQEAYTQFLADSTEFSNKYSNQPDDPAVIKEAHEELQGLYDSLTALGDKVGYKYEDAAGTDANAEGETETTESETAA